MGTEFHNSIVYGPSGKQRTIALNCLRLWAQGFGFLVQDLGLSAQGLEFRV